MTTELQVHAKRQSSENLLSLRDLPATQHKALLQNPQGENMNQDKKNLLETFVGLLKMGWPEDRIRPALIKLMGIRQEEIAKAIGMKRQTFNNYIQGDRKDRLQQKKIASLFGIPPKIMFGDTHGRT